MATYTPATSGVLSEEDYLYCFEIAGVIWDASTKASIHDGFGLQLSLTDLGTLQSDLRTRLAGFDTQTVTHIQDMITNWVPIRYSTAEMDAGAVGDTTGMKYSPKNKRDQIKELFAGITGCMGIYQARMSKKNAIDGEQTVGVIGIRRG